MIVKEVISLKKLTIFVVSIIFLHFLSPSALAVSDSISIGSGNGVAGGTVTLPITFTYSQDMFMVGVKLSFDTNVLSTDFSTDFSGFLSDIGSLESSDTYLIQYMMTDSPIAAGIYTSYVTFHIAPNAPEGDYEIALYDESGYLNMDSATYGAVNVSFVNGSITVGAGGGSTSIPAGDIEKPTGVDMTVEGSYDGSNATISVACDTACVVVGVKGGVYRRLTYDGTSGHTFTTDAYEDGMTFIVAVKGDVDGSGSITPTDWGSLIEAYNGSSLSDLGAIVGDVDGSGSITPTDWGSLIEAYNGSSLAWN